MGAGLLRQKFFDEFAAEVVEDGFGDHCLVVGVEGEGAEFEGGVAEAGELVLCDSFGQGKFGGVVERFFGPFGGGGEGVGRGAELKVFACVGAEGEVDRRAVGDEIARVRVFEAALEGGIVGFPDESAGGDGGEVEVAFTEVEFKGSVAGC